MIHRGRRAPVSGDAAHFLGAFACCLMVGVTAARPGSAQRAPRAHLAPAAIGQIVDAALDTLIPRGAAFSRVPVARRGMVFDYERMATAFERRGNPRAAFAELHIRTAADPGTRAILRGCSDVAPMPCSRLGWKVYVSVVPIALGDTRVEVRVEFAWADRGRTPFVDGVAPTGDAYLTGFARTVVLVRGPGGRWIVSKLGDAEVGD